MTEYETYTLVSWTCYRRRLSSPEWTLACWFYAKGHQSLTELYITLVGFNVLYKWIDIVEKLQQIIHSRWPKVVNSIQEEAKPSFLVHRELLTKASLIFRRNHLVVPRFQWGKFVHGHQGVVTVQHLRELYWWQHLVDLVCTVLFSLSVWQNTCPITSGKFLQGPFPFLFLHVKETLAQSQLIMDYTSCLRLLVEHDILSQMDVWKSLIPPPFY